MYKSFCLSFSFHISSSLHPFFFSSFLFVPYRLLFIVQSLLDRNSRQVLWTSMQDQLGELSQELLKCRDNFLSCCFFLQIDCCNKFPEFLQDFFSAFVATIVLPFSFRFVATFFELSRQLFHHLPFCFVSTILELSRQFWNCRNNLFLPWSFQLLFLLILFPFILVPTKQQIW